MKIGLLKKFLLNTIINFKPQIIILIILYNAGCKQHQPKIPDTDLVNDPAVMWAGSVKGKVIVDKNSTILRDFNDGKGLLDYLLADMMSGAIKTYDIESNLLTLEDLKSSMVIPDTTLEIDPETLEEKSVISTIEVINSLTKIRLIQDLFFIENKAAIIIQLKAVLILEEKYDNNGNYLGDLPSYIIKQGNSKNTMDSLPDMNANTVWQHTVSSNIELSNSYECITHKSINGKGLIEYLLESIQNNKLQILNHNNQPVSYNEFKNNLLTIDTTMTIDTETAEDLLFIDSSYGMGDIHNIRIKQALYYNSKTHLISTKLRYIGLLQDKYDQQGNLLGNKLVAWINFEGSEDRITASVE